MPVLLVAPTGREAGAGGPAAFVCGAGRVSGDQLAARLSSERPDVVVHFGYGGGLDPSLGPGSLVLARLVSASGQDDLVPAAALLEAVRGEFRRQGLAFVTSRLLTVNRPVAGARARATLWNRWGAAAVDMETYRVARAAHQAGVPWVAFRAVVDPAWRSLPPLLASWDGQDGDAAIARRAAAAPWQLPALARLALEARRADRSLRAGVPAALAACALLADSRTGDPPAAGSIAAPNRDERGHT
jgi:hypothetical protein